jgi:hypothetical protein
VALDQVSPGDETTSDTVDSDPIPVAGYALGHQQDRITHGDLDDSQNPAKRTH